MVPRLGSLVPQILIAGVLPIIGYALLRPHVPSDAFDKRWDMPTVPRRFRFSTAVWGTALVGETIVRTVLAISIPTQRFLVLAQLINWSLLAGLFWFTILYSRAGARQVAILMAKTT